MTEHPDCTSCPHVKGKGSCEVFRHCGRWLSWFNKTWRGIRQAGAIVKKWEEKGKNGHEDESDRNDL